LAPPAADVTQFLVRFIPVTKKHPSLGRFDVKLF
jgi:hypothetical protein